VKLDNSVERDPVVSLASFLEMGFSAFGASSNRFN